MRLIFSLIYEIFAKLDTTGAGRVFRNLLVKNPPISAKSTPSGARSNEPPYVGRQLLMEPPPPCITYLISAVRYSYGAANKANYEKPCSFYNYI